MAILQQEPVWKASVPVSSQRETETSPHVKHRSTYLSKSSISSHSKSWTLLLRFVECAIVNIKYSGSDFRFAGLFTIKSITLPGKDEYRYPSRYGNCRWATAK